MKDQKHTPGPWNFSDDGFIYSSDREMIADPHCSKLDLDEREANAKLIAAAPELLSICLSILKDDEQEGTLLPLDRVKLKNAIHNATV